ncbi:alpha/beta hydrolase [Yinghuangia seranimata]|uniref:alpha/beta hydrolase n=1 Tax=Yinghuangia seranimata TaxID=408067 RepID=UPI00248BAD0A|nr:alpha/beta hydrolase-fold protein [Yinghuangia seranimata]MDI2127219.1 alpha/beta hydrolase-fold protein [Yinghuangia seranimata]
MNPLDWRLYDGPVPVLLQIFGCAAIVALLARRDRRWWLVWVPVIALVAITVALFVGVIVDDWWKPFPDPLPRDVLKWTAVAAFGVGLAAARMKSLTWRLRGAAVLGALLVVAISASQVNAFYQEYPTLRAALGPWLGRSDDFDKARGVDRQTVAAPPEGWLSQVWQPPPGMPKNGTVSEVSIPGTVSKFKAQNGWVYLPPAYLATPRAQVPVLILLAGQPGEPRDWIDAGQVVDMMDGYAAKHGGLAPIVVMPDDLGGPFDNPLCLDSKLGNSETYLTRDVPAWINANLKVSPAPRGWAVAGLSHGGTCSLQMAVRKPDLFHSFVDISGQDEPSLGSRKETVDKAFGGDAAAFARVNPLDVLKATRYPQVSGIFVVGSGDDEFGPQQRNAFAGAKAAGMDVQYEELPGGHSWQVWRPGLANNLAWLARQTGLVGP